MIGIKRPTAAFIFSFAIYLTPLVGPHALFLLGEVVWREFGNAFHHRGDHTFAWVATDVGIAFFAQIVSFMLAYWFIGRPGWLRGLCLGLSTAPAIILLNHAYMIAIPTYFLVETDTAVERGTWPLECSIRDVWIPQIASSPSVLPGAPIWLADVNPPNRYALFNPEGCTVTKLDLAQSAMGYVAYVAGGRALYMAITPATGKSSWFVFDVAANTKTPIEVSAGQAVILSNDGGSVAWLRPVAGSTPPIPLEVVIRRVDGHGEAVVDLSALGRGGMQQLIQFDSDARELVIARGLSDLFWVGIDGRIRKTLTKPDGVEPQPRTYLFQSDGWVAWDAYRENQPYRVAWSLPSGKGSYQVPKSRVLRHSL